MGAMFDGPIDIVGDVHGELDALRALLERLGYAEDGTHRDGRRLVFVGDLCDRGADSPGVIELVRELMDRQRAQCILGNHELNLLRRDEKHGNRWYLDPSHPEQRGEFAHCKPAPSDHTWHELFLSLPLALERPDLRVVHATWHGPGIEQLRTRGARTSLHLFEHYERATDAFLAEQGIADAAAAEAQAHAIDLIDPARPVPLLRNLGARDELRQMRNPLRVLTSGPERVTTSPFFANGKWRMCDRVRWWDEYTDDTPVIIGHYWRVAHGEDEPSLSGGKPDLFAGSAPHAWLGPRNNVFCVDFSIGGRYRERARGVAAFTTRLAAVRWPERRLVFEDGTTSAMTPAW